MRGYRTQNLINIKNPCRLTYDVIYRGIQRYNLQYIRHHISEDSFIPTAVRKSQQTSVQREQRLFIFECVCDCVEAEMFHSVSTR